MRHLGTRRPGSTVYVPFDAFGSNGESVTVSNFAVTDIEVYKDGNTTQRSSDNGYTLLDTDGIDFDGVTGLHGISISLADNSDAGFWAAGAHYRVTIAPITINSQTVNFTPVTFEIGYENAIINTTIATLASQTSFTLTAGPAEDDALNGMEVIIHDVASAVQLGRAVILDYTGSTKTVTLAAGTTFTAAATDNISIMGPSPLQPAVMGRTLAVETDGMAHADVKEWKGSVPANLADTDKVPASVQHMAANVLNAAATHADYVTEMQAAVAAALTAYDPPTEAEMNARTLAAAAYATAAALTTAQGNITDILADTEVNIPALIGTPGVSLADDIAAVFDALFTDNQAEPTGVPAASLPPMVKLSWIFRVLRNGLEVNSGSGEIGFKNDAGAIDFVKAVSDDGTTYTEGEAAAP